MALAGGFEQERSALNFDVNSSSKASLEKKVSPTRQVYLRSPLVLPCNEAGFLAALLQNPIFSTKPAWAMVSVVYAGHPARN